ncbi:MAG: signal peptidase I [Hydrogenophaga sp.]
MSTLTALVLGAFATYVGAFVTGRIEGNFALMLMVATAITGLYWVAERLYFLPQRKRAASHLEAASVDRSAALRQQGFEADASALAPAREKLLRQPWWLDWTAGLFPVILVVFVLRSFLFEPFKIPSGSMIPTLRVGDLILVNKFHYGIRMPVFNRKLVANNLPVRGDVMVFRYPPQPSLDYIKRVVGIPGDEVAYLNKKLTINGQAVPTTAAPEFFDKDGMRYVKQFSEVQNDRHYNTLNYDESPAFVPGASDFTNKQNCRYSIEGVVCKVPDGHYFLMGDNRDDSLDSRYWGFVPEANIVGKAFFVWMNFGDLGRFGSFE